tara:strand:- start:900 stop:1199 length:300 start_codon:yes stop_codon:yes gene_type:complete
MDINELNNRITQLEEQNKALIDYINATLLERVNTNTKFINLGSGHTDIQGWRGHVELKELINEFEPPPPSPPLPVATEAIPVLTIPSAPPKPPRKKIMC